MGRLAQILGGLSLAATLALSSHAKSPRPFVDYADPKPPTEQRMLSRRSKNPLRNLQEEDKNILFVGLRVYRNDDLLERRVRLYHIPDLDYDGHKILISGSGPTFDTAIIDGIDNAVVEYAESHDDYDLTEHYIDRTKPVSPLEITPMAEGKKLDKEHLRTIIAYYAVIDSLINKSGKTTPLSERYSVDMIVEFGSKTIQ
ncbi:MAG: hypothetical protein ACE5FT_06440 [Candidatus Nanoarchaeia archaeon]